MQKKYVLLHKVLRQFDRKGILDDLILIGSWCMHFYEHYFSGKDYQPLIRTKDIDFLVPIPVRKTKRVDVAEILKEEGFLVTFSNRGFMRLEHPDIIIEFLVPERGKGTDRPYPLPNFGVNAQALRFLDFLIENSIVLETEDLRIRVPHPAAFAIHKMVISHRRQNEEKVLKERTEALLVLDAILKQDGSEYLKGLFQGMPKSWRGKAIQTLNESGREDILNILT